MLRLLLSFFGTLSLDFNTFMAWSQRLGSVPFRQFYDSWSDYLPGYLYILWALGKIGKIFEFIPKEIIYKLPANLADIFTGWLIYAIVKKLKDEKKALIAAALYLFNPAVFANSSLWGQVDSLTSFFGLLSVWLTGINPWLSALFLSLAVLVKPQAAVAAVVIVYLAYKNHWSIKKLALYILLAGGVFILGFFPFAKDGNLIGFFLERIGISFNQYPYTSVNAFNFWALYGLWKPDGGSFFSASIIGSALSGGLLLYLFTKIKSKKIAGMEYVLLSACYLITFLFVTRMHERHLLPALAPLAISIFIFTDTLIAYIVYSITYLANLWYSYRWISNDFETVLSDIVIKFIAVINLTALVVFIRSLTSTPRNNLYWQISQRMKKLSMNNILSTLKCGVSSQRKNVCLYSIHPHNKLPGSLEKSHKKAVTIKLPRLVLSDKKIKTLLVLVILFSLATRLLYLGSPGKEYFDEVYHAFTARVILQNDPKAWEWWNPNPEGFAYEWTHPPLAKLIMVAGMKIFGENAFGWRFPVAVAGTISIYLVYLISRKIFKDEASALFAAAIFSLDGLVLVMSRIGMNDIYFLLFALAAIYFYLDEKDFLAAIAFGLALSAKWSAIWAIPILGLVWLRRKNKFRPSMIWFLFIPPLIYLSSYLPMFLSGHGSDIFVEMQRQMWWYHTGLKASHPYTSPWWSWPLDLRPVYLYTSEEVNGWVARIYNLGNPIVFWSGLGAILISAGYSYLEKNKSLGLVVFSYLVFFIPWAASPRIMFFYHYLPSLPFLAIALGYVLRRNPKYILPIFSLAVLAFVYFYPHWTGIEIPLWLDKSYYWFSSWR